MESTESKPSWARVFLHLRQMSMLLLLLAAAACTSLAALEAGADQELVELKHRRAVLQISATRIGRLRLALSREEKKTERLFKLSESRVHWSCKLRKLSLALQRFPQVQVWRGEARHSQGGPTWQALLELRFRSHGPVPSWREFLGFGCRMREELRIVEPGKELRVESWFVFEFYDR